MSKKRLENIFEHEDATALINITDKQSASPLHFAVDAACPTAVEFLLQHDEHPDLKDIDDFGPLLRLSLAADVDGFRKTVDLLMRHGFDIKHTDVQQRKHPVWMQ